MSDYISRKEAVSAIVAARDQRMKEQPYGWEWEYNGFNSAIQALPIPAAEVKPVVRSYWEKEPDGGYVCHECRQRPLLDGSEADALSDYCPSCGADMREEEK